MIVNLKKIINENDLSEVKKMQAQFELHGWCFVKLPKELRPKSDLIKDLTEFFENGINNERYTNPTQVYGYSKVGHKEGIKLLTGSHFQNMVNNGLLPVRGKLVGSLNYLSQAFDTVTKRLIEILDQHSVFQEQPSLSTLIRRADLPLKDEHFGMLDIVSYFNEKTRVNTSSKAKSTDEVNCVAHYDPGLLSISILSTLQGLQLKNRLNDEWIDGPLESKIGVIWLGEAASQITNNRLKSGIHRVIYPEKSKRRLTIWYELCTTQQLENLSDEKKNEPMHEGTIVFDSLPNADPINVLPKENKLDFLKRVEKTQGLSMSKIAAPYFSPSESQLSYPSNSNNWY